MRIPIGLCRQMNRHGLLQSFLQEFCVLAVALIVAGSAFAEGHRDGGGGGNRSIGVTSTVTTPSIRSLNPTLGTGGHVGDHHRLELRFVAGHEHS